ncbi:MAG: LamG domain-containing protein, partial [Anaerolineales bacterium]|nr:LamG domain-containing protein [Anaerolineales bacterium]
DEWYVLRQNITDAEWIDDDGTIDDLRFAFLGLGETNGSFYIDYVKFYKEESGPTYVDGKYEKALQFDGTDDYVYVPDIALNESKPDRSTTIEFSPDATIMFWVKRGASSDDMIIGRYNEDESDMIWHVSLSDSTLSAYFDDDATAYDEAYLTTSSVSGVADTWHHVAITKDNAACNLFWDGAVVQTSYGCPNTIDTSRAEGLSIGRKSNSTGSFYFNGTLDELKIFNEKLTDAEIDVHYRSSLNKYGYNNWTLYINQTNLTVGASYNYDIYYAGRASFSSTSEIRRISGNAAPTFILVSNTPSSINDVDPNTTIYFTVNVSDTDSNFDTAILQYRATADSDWTNVTMTNTSAKDYYTGLNISLDLGATETNYTYRIYANDTLGSVGLSGNTTLQAFWDRTWTMGFAYDSVSGRYNQNKEIGNLTVNNTGDYALTVVYVGDDSPFGLYYKDSGETQTSFTLTSNATSKESKTIQMNGTFGATDRNDTVIFTAVGLGQADPTTLNDNFTLLTFSGGAFLEVGIDNYEASVNQSSTFELGGYVRNIGDNYSYDTDLNWSLPSEFTVSDGNATNQFGNLISRDQSGTYTNRSDLNITLDETISAGFYTVYLLGQGTNGTETTS